MPSNVLYSPNSLPKQLTPRDYSAESSQDSSSDEMSVENEQIQMKININTQLHCKHLQFKLTIKCIFQ